MIYSSFTFSLTKFEEEKNLSESLSLAQVRLVLKFTGARIFSAPETGRLMGLELKAMGEDHVTARHSHDMLIFGSCAQSSYILPKSHLEVFCLSSNLSRLAMKTPLVIRKLN